MQFKDNAAEEQLSLLRQLIEEQPHGIVVVNIDNNEFFEIQFANQEIYRKSGYSRFNLIGKHINTLIDDFLHEKHINHLKQWAKDPVVIDFNDRHSKVVMRCKDGTRIRVEIKIYPLYKNLDGNLILTKTGEKSSVYGAAAVVFKEEV